MSSVFLDPASDVSTSWNIIFPTTPTTHFDKISKAIRQPTAPLTTSFVNDQANSGSHSEEYLFGTTSAIGSGTVSAVTLWVYDLLQVGVVGQVQLSGSIKTPGKNGGAYLALVTVNPTTVGWQSLAFTGLSWSQSDINAITAKLTAIHPTTKLATSLINYASYLEITYSSGASFHQGLPLPIFMRPD